MVNPIFSPVIIFIFVASLICALLREKLIMRHICGKGVVVLLSVIFTIIDILRNGSNVETTIVLIHDTLFSDFKHINFPHF